MYNRVVIADTSCLISLSRINALNLLFKLYKEIVVTPEVASEFRDNLPDWVIVEEANDKLRAKILCRELDIGEASAITLALESADSLLIIDERKGRKVAKSLGIRIMGTLGVLVLAKEKGLIQLIKPYLTALTKIDFRLSDRLIEGILKRTGENDD